MRQLSTQPSPSYRAIDAVIDFLSPVRRRGAYSLSESLTDSLIGLLDEWTEAGLLISALDCCAVDPLQQQVLGVPIRFLRDKLWTDRGAVQLTVAESLGVRATKALAKLRCLIDDLARLVNDRRIDAARLSVDETVNLFYQGTIPLELGQATADFFKSMAAAACMVAASQRGKRLPAKSAATLVETLAHGLVALLPWLQLVQPIAFSEQTRQLVPRIDFPDIFGRFAFQQFERRLMFETAAASVTPKPAPKRKATTKRPAKYAAAS